MNTELDQFIKMIKHPAKSRMFLFFKLPSAFFSGVRIEKISGSSCTVVIPYKWFSQNPFHSTYFACLAMAAELSTGALAMAHLYKRKEKLSMLVTGMNATFQKKATGRTYFVCDDGNRLRDAIQQAIETRNGISITTTSTGSNAQGDVVAVFTFQWSFKVKA
jgi:hypothetical protein